MYRTKHFSIFVIIFGGIATSNATQPIKWTDLTPYQHQLVTFVLPESSPQVWDEVTIQSFIEKQGTRSGTYHAIGLLFRNEGADRENAQRMIRGILALQHNSPGEKLHGAWRTGVTKDHRDENWREFVGTGLIVVREYFGEVMDPVLIHAIDVALICAAQGAAVRDVSAEYTNIALMSAFLMDYVGHTSGNLALQEKGKAKAQVIVDLFRKYNTFTEFNSPTYYGANLMGLGLWRELGKSSELRNAAKPIETAFWADIAQGYHAGLKNMCGPYIRSYGMDMTKYNALVGMCIAMGLDGPENAPLPQTRDRAFEWAYAPVFALLQIQPPDYLSARFKSLGKVREFHHQIPSHKGDFQTHTLLESNWMMGAASGIHRRWDQHCPGTIHWTANSRGGLGWLLVHGSNGADVKIVDRSLHILLPQPDDQHPLRILVHAPEIELRQFDKDQWTLPGMGFDIQTPLVSPTIKFVKDKYLGQVFEIAFPVPGSLASDTPALVLTPRKTR
jgi:hypothetical protein